MIRANPRLRAKDLAEYFNISEKRVYDDIRTLNEACVPIVFHDKGYRILETFFLPPISFSFEEAASLLFALSLLKNYGYSFESFSPDIFASKVLAVIKEPNRSKLSKFFQKVTSSSPWDYPLKYGILSAICDAIQSRTRLKVKYESASGKALTEREVDPYALTHRRHAWYLVGYCVKNKQVRTFKVQRIINAKPTMVHFPEPESFSIDEYFSDSWGVMGGDKYDVVAVFSPEVRQYILEKRFKNAAMLEREDGSVIFQTTVRGLFEIRMWLLQYGCKVEVLEPQCLREDIKSEVAKMANIYNPIGDYRNKKNKMDFEIRKK